MNSAAPARTVRLGFAGVGWIGRNRMSALADSSAVEVVAVADPVEELRAAALERAPGAHALSDFEDLLDLDLDGIVIATPSALHAAQATVALERGVAVFCQKPLGRDAAETEHVVAAARRSDRLLALDLCYRHTAASRRLRDLVQDGALGHIYAAELTFHNAYGPDKSWFTDRALAGGGCLIDLGTHLVDLAIWLLGARDVSVKSASVLRRGERLPRESCEVEDYAVAELELDSDARARLACSWWLPVGRDCAIEVVLYGTEAAAALRNVDGSFYDFRCELMRGTATERQTEAPDRWGGRAALAWAHRLANDSSYDPEADELVRTARVLDAIYETAP
ncbi:MAG TPA: Gfo/Idh/MocA family oxidoreductase [Thermoleophilaceae bacterium]|nr:Gfo/Idh/MocA family oxidoreductase [Thermoleophilaceae bacterium]